VTSLRAKHHNDCKPLQCVLQSNCRKAYSERSIGLELTYKVHSTRARTYARIVLQCDTWPGDWPHSERVIEPLHCHPSGDVL
jgi:hypothetical protein